MFRTQPLLLLSRFHAFRFPNHILCYRPPTSFYSIPSRTLVLPLRTTYQTPRILRVTRLGPP